MGISRVYISPMAGPSWQLLHCAVHGPHGWNQVPVEGHRQAVWSQHRQRHEVPVQAQRWRLERSSCCLALQKPLDALNFWGQHSNNKSLSVRMVASRAKRTMEPNRLNISTFHNVFLFFSAERFWNALPASCRKQLRDTSCSSNSTWTEAALLRVFQMRLD